VTETELMPLLTAYGLLPESTRTVARPRLDKGLRRQLARVKKLHREELASAKQMRMDVLNITRGVARPRIIEELVAEGHTEAAYLLTFNDEQLALILAWRDAKQKPGASSQRVDEVGGEARQPGASSHQGQDENA
jgi:hypothetical protein